MTIGGDHTIALPLLRAAAQKHGPVALVHFDAHLDTWDTYFGAEYTHGTPFRRAVEEGILDTEALSHVGTRGPLYGKKDLEDDRRFGFGIVTSSDVYYQGVREVVDKLRQRLGDRPVYVSIDIDVLDPAHAPGTGTPEAGGMTSRELLEILRGFRRAEPGRRRRRRGVAGLRPRRDHRRRGLARRLRPGVAAGDAARGGSDVTRNGGGVTRNGGDVVVETLTALGVSHVFGIPGQHALGLFDAIRRSDLTFVSSRVENNSAFGADGYARATGEVGVLFLSTGPGALTALGALQEAYATGVPLLVIVSQVPRAGLGLRRGMLHQLDDQQRSAINVTKSTAVARARRRDPQPARRRVVAGPGRACGTDVGGDTAGRAAGTCRRSCRCPRWSPPSQNVPRERKLVDAAAALLNSAQRPVILAGGGVRRSRGGPEALVALAELLDAPVVSTVGGKGAIPFDHPLSAASWIEDRHTTALLEDADVLLAVGTAMGEVTSNYFTFAPEGPADPRSTPNPACWRPTTRRWVSTPTPRSR